MTEEQSARDRFENLKRDFTVTYFNQFTAERREVPFGLKSSAFRAISAFMDGYMSLDANRGQDFYGDEVTPQRDAFFRLENNTGYGEYYCDETDEIISCDGQTEYGPSLPQIGTWIICEKITFADGEEIDIQTLHKLRDARMTKPHSVSDFYFTTPAETIKEMADQIGKPKPVVYFADSEKVRQKLDKIVKKSRFLGYDLSEDVLSQIGKYITDANMTANQFCKRFDQNLKLARLTQ